MKYKIGDKVRVLPAVAKEINPRTNNTLWFMDDGETRDSITYGMARLAGSIVTIERYLANKYILKESSSWWTDEMLCPVFTEEFE